MTIDIIELDQLLTELISDPAVDSKYQSRLKRLKASIDPSGRFNLSRDPIWVRDESKYEPLAQGSLENDSVAHAIDRLVREENLYVGLRRNDPAVEYKRPADSEGGHAD